MTGVKVSPLKRAASGYSIDVDPTKKPRMMGRYWEEEAFVLAGVADMQRLHTFIDMHLTDVKAMDALLCGCVFYGNYNCFKEVVHRYDYTKRKGNEEFDLNIQECIHQLYCQTRIDPQNTVAAETLKEAMALF